MSLSGLLFNLIEHCHVTACCASRQSAVILWTLLQQDRVLSLCEHFYNRYSAVICGLLCDLMECCNFLDWSTTWLGAVTLQTAPQPDRILSLCELLNKTPHQNQCTLNLVSYVWDKNEVIYFCVGSLVQILIRYVEDGNRLPFRNKDITPSTKVSDMAQIIRIWSNILLVTARR